MSGSFWRFACAVTALAVSTPSWADTISAISITGNVYTEPGRYDITPTSSAGLRYEGSFTASNINFNTGSGETLGDFLRFGDPTANFQNGSGANRISTRDLNARMSSNGFFGLFDTYSTVIEITGTFTFQAGNTYTITHDDGIVLKVNGSILSPFDLPDPTPAEASSWTPTSTITNASFDLWYMATAGNPEVLQLTDPPPAIPEPSSIVLFGTVALGVVGVIRRKKTIESGKSV